MRAVALLKQSCEPVLVPDYPDPLPAERECVVRVRMAGICATDLHLIKGYMNFQGVLGHELVGTVVRGSAEWLDKRVVCEINCVCRRCEMCQAGLSNHCRERTVIGIDGRDGCFADLITVPEHNLHQIPDVISDEQAVFVEPLAAAHQVLVQCPIDERASVAVVGTGRLGLLVGQVIASTGCRLTMVGRNPKKLLLCEKLRMQPEHVDELIPRKDRDVVVECTGSPKGLELAMELVKPRGTIVLKSTHADAGPLNLSPLVVNEVKLIGSRCGPFPEAIDALAREAVDVRPLITRIYPLEKAAEAFESARRSDSVKILFSINRQ